MTIEEAKPMARVFVWHCPHCTWFRARTSRETWEREIITHPVYGFISQFDAAVKDIERHDCEATRMARIRHGMDPLAAHQPYVYDKARDRRRGRDYEPFKDEVYYQ